jgi:Flp pilus assembly protein TadG
MRDVSVAAQLHRVWQGFGHSLARQASCFTRDERGVTAVLFGILFAVMFLMAAVVVDLTRATHEQFRQQAAVDAAALAASHYLGQTDQDVAGKAAAKRFFEMNMGAGSTAEVDVQLDQAAGTVTARSSNDLGTTLMAANVKAKHQVTELDVGASTKVVKGSGTVEVAMVLDNSGSMSGSKLTALKTSANNLLNIVFAGADQTGDVKVGLIPFATSVNVGAVYRGADWMDNDGQSSIHYQNVSANVTRFALFDQLNVAWGGCVEARPAPYDVSDAPPDSSDGDTLFVPMFAPDEPDNQNAAAAGYTSTAQCNDSTCYGNSYLSDFEGACPKICTRRRSNGSCRTWDYDRTTLPVETAQSRTCKYDGGIPVGSMTSSFGPNYMCKTRAILPLTTSKSDAETAVNAMIADGNTNISEGTAWGLRVLSPTEPFTDGLAYNDANNRKVMIVMTDGDNYLDDRETHNKSIYAAYGYGSKNRLGTTYTASSYTTNLNSKTQAACANAKAAGIVVYTIAFGTNISATGLSLLQQCATSTDHAFRATNTTALNQAFQNIGREISKLRISS